MVASALPVKKRLIWSNNIRSANILKASDCAMNDNNYESYDELLQNLNAVKNELKKRNDVSLNTCIDYIKKAIFEVGRMNAKYANLSAQYDAFRLMHSFIGQDDADDWSED